MKIIELTSKITVPITNEENDLLQLFSKNPMIAKHQLNEREQVLANQLTIKDILSRVSNDGKIYYKKKINQLF